MTYNAKRQRAQELEWLRNHRPYDRIQGVSPYDRTKRGIIPVPPYVYAPAGGIGKIAKGLLRPGDTGLLKDDHLTST